jgi:hypothetical protein
MKGARMNMSPTLFQRPPRRAEDTSNTAANPIAVPASNLGLTERDTAPGVYGIGQTNNVSRRGMALRQTRVTEVPRTLHRTLA